MKRTLILSLGAAVLLSPACSEGGTIAGRVFLDENRNGISDPGEAALGGLEIALLGASGSVMLTAATAADGSYAFEGLSDGGYVVSARPPAGLRRSLADVTADPAPIPDFPFGRPRYASPAGIARNLAQAAAAGAAYRHVALGDSIGFGFSVCGSPLGGNGYIEPATARLRAAAGGPVITDKQAIPGHETADLLIPGAGPDLPLFDNDLFYAIDERAPLVSISIGGNDFLGAEDGGDSELAAAIVIARRNLQEISSTLLSELPRADVEINTVYDNLAGEDPLHNVWVPIWNQVLREGAWGQNRTVTLAEVYPEYAHDEDGLILGQPDLVCNDPLGLDGIHPTVPGYDVHEQKLWQAFGGVTLVDGSEQLAVDLGFLPVAGKLLATGFSDISGDASDPELALALDGSGAKISASDAEFRVTGFLPDGAPPGVDLTAAIVKIRYRTRGAPLDDYYAFEASLDGSFSEPGDTPFTWNTILPIVGSSGNDGAVRLAFPDQPEYRVVATTLYAGSPAGLEDNLSWEDLENLSVRVVTTAVGEPDAYSIEWDSSLVQVFTRPAQRAPAPAQQSAAMQDADILRLAGRDRAAAREGLRARLSMDEPVSPLLIEAVAELGEAAERTWLEARLEAPDPLLRGHALRALLRLDPAAYMERLRTAARDPSAAVRRVAARALTRTAEPADSPLLLALLADPDAIVRRNAARALARLPVGRDSLRRASVADPARTVRIEAAAGLLAGGDAGAIPMLLDALGGELPLRRARAALLDYGQPHPALLRGALHADAQVRATTAWLLGHLTAPGAEGIETLAGLLADDEPAVRFAAVEALAAHGRTLGLEQALRDPARGRFAVSLIRAARRLESLSAYTTLAAIAGDPAARPSARYMAARALALAPDPSAAGALLRPLREDSDRRIRRIAEAGLQRLDKR